MTLKIFNTCVCAPAVELEEVFKICHEGEGVAGGHRGVAGLAVGSQAKGMDMNPALLGYDEQLFSMLKVLTNDMQTGSAKQGRMLSNKILLSQGTGLAFRQVAMTLGLTSDQAEKYGSQMEEFLNSNSGISLLQ